MVSTATTNFLVLFTSSSTSVQFMFYVNLIFFYFHLISKGMMNYEYGVACVICSSLGSIMGNIIINRIIQKTKKMSILIYVLGIVIGLSTIVIPLQTIMDIYNDLQEGKDIMKFNSPC